MSATPIQGPAALAGTVAQHETRELRQAAEAFESLLLSTLVRRMRESQLRSGFFGEGTGASTYDAMFEEHLAGALARSSPLGIADRLEQLWNSRGTPAAEALRAGRELERATEGTGPALKYPARMPIRGMDIQDGGGQEREEP